MEVLRCNDSASWDNLEHILKGLWAWAVWTPANTRCGRGCHSVILHIFNWATKRDLKRSRFGSLGTWINDRSRDDATSDRGGMFPLEPGYTPTCDDLKSWLWASYPLHLSEAIDRATAARAELAQRVVTLLEEARQKGPALSVQNRTVKNVRQCTKMVYRPLLDIAETFLEVSPRRQRRKQLLAYRSQCRQWQASRRVSDYPAAYSMSFLEGEFPPLVDTPIQSDINRRNLHKDPFTLVQAAEPMGNFTLPPTTHEWNYKEFLDAHPESEI